MTPAPDILWNLFISFSPPHTKSFYISTFLHLKRSWSRCFFFSKIYDLGKVPTKCRPFSRCFGVNIFEIFCEKLRYFVISTNGRKYCRCRMGDHQVRVFAHHCRITWGNPQSGCSDICSYSKRATVGVRAPMRPSETPV